MSSLLVPSRRSARLLAGFITLGLLAGGQLAIATPAFAAGAAPIVVTSTADSDATAACTTANTTLSSPVTLRSALCVANNLGGSVDITVPAGTFQLTNALGSLVSGTKSGANISLRGAGAANTIIRGSGSTQVFTLDPLLAGGVAVSMSGLTITGGVDNVDGGGAIIGGSASSTVSDSLTLTNVTVTGNQANTTGSATSNPGGAIQFIGGSLSIVDSIISNNSSGSSPGGGVAYQAAGAAGESLTISGTTFSGNSTRTAGNLPNGGAALSIDSAPYATGGAAISITDSTFTGNTAVGGTGEPSRGGAIWQRGGKLVVESSTFTGNTLAPADATAGAAIQLDGGTLTASYNRFSGNVGGAALAVGAESGATTQATQNWWGCPTPGAAGCGAIVGAAASAYTPYLTLTATAETTPILPPGTTTAVTASLLKDSNGIAVDASKLTAFAGVPVVWGTPAPAGATVSPSTSALIDGVARTTVDVGAGVGPGSLAATLDQGVATASFAIHAPAKITSGATAQFVVGTAGSSTITTTGYPYPAISVSGTLPGGVALVDNHDGTASLSGTPSAKSGTVYPITVRATNDVGSAATMPFVLTVSEAPSFTSDTSATFATGTGGSFTVTSSGFPVGGPITLVGALPDGVTFVDNGDGTATLSGTPSATAGGQYPLTFDVSNGTAPDASQGFLLTVAQAIAITRQPVDTVAAAGATASFSAAASGFPAPSVQWERSLDDGQNYTSLSGATSTTLNVSAAQGETGGLYRAAFTSGGTTLFSDSGRLTVYTPVVVLPIGPQTLTVNGSRQSVTVSTVGSPAATLSVIGAPSWLALTDNGAGGGSLDGTPPVGSGGQYSVTLSASNGFGTTVSQTITLTVNEAPRVASDGSVTFTVEQPARFDFETAHSYPVVTAFGVSGVLPDGIQFYQAGGVGYLAGTPAADSEGTYTVLITASNGVAVSQPQLLTITVTALPVITLDPVDQFVATGSTVTFTAGASGFPNPTVKWQVAPRAGAAFADMPGETSTTLSVRATGALDGYQYRAVFSGAGSTTTSAVATLKVGTVPAITSQADVTFSQAGGAQSFTVRTTAIPDAVLTETGILPSWLTFTDNGDGTATLAGDPAAGVLGEITFDIDATNRFGAAATQAFTLTITSVPSISSGATAAFEVGVTGSHTVTTVQGFPVAASLELTGSLPNGLRFSDRGDGTAVISGAPAAGSGGVYTVTVHARNAAGTSAPQSLVVTIAEAPTVTSANTATIVRGVDSSFVITTSAAYPAATAITVTGSLPAGLVVTDNNDGTASVSGLTTDAAADFTLDVTADNGIGAGASQALTLHLVDAPVIQLPIVRPDSDGPLSGAPTETVPGASVHVYGPGFAPGSTVTFGIYSAPRTLGTAIADANGEANAALTIPTDLSGSHTIVASGIDRAGNPRFLSWAIEVTPVVDPATPETPTTPTDSTPTGSGTAVPSGGSSTSSIAETGPGYDVSLAALLALLLVAAGALVFTRRRRTSS